MLNLPEGQFFNDILSRVEQSRVSYNSQAEEFRQLNTNFQTYVNDIKRIDDENSQLQNHIEQIRTNYIRTLETHLKRLPEDFHQESHILTDAHLERYKSKSRAKRFVNEREELKKRINFLGNNEKEHIKRLNHLQRQERTVQNELKNLNEQMQNLYNYVEREKQIHRQATEKVDQLQIQLEHVSVERSKTEFEVQNLREEVKLMQTAKEFLDDEYQTILATQTEANEYFLSCLNESISRIREDFDDLNKRQVNQVEYEYKQMMKVVEENSLAKATITETVRNRQRTVEIECEKLQDEHQSVAQELTTLNDHNQILSEHILSMEADLCAMRDERTRELATKENELEQTKVELQSLNEKLNHLTEYDRNLKFELTLYRGVLESEYRRKQQQQQQSNSTQQLARPTILRTTTTRSNKSSPVLMNQNQLERNGETSNTQVDESQSRTSPLENETTKTEEEMERPESLSKEWKKSFNQDEQDIKESITTTYQEQRQTPEDTLKSPVSTDQLASPEPQPLPANHEVVRTNTPPDLSNSMDDRQTSLETSTLSENQSKPFEFDQSHITVPESPTSAEILPTNEDTSLTSTSTISSEVPQSISTLSEDQSISANTEEGSAAPSAIDSQIRPDLQETSLASVVSEEQQESTEVLQSFPLQSEEQQEPLLPDQPFISTSDEVQQLSIISPTDEHKSSVSPTIQTEDQYKSAEPTEAVSLETEEQPESAEIHQTLPTSEEEVQQPSTMSPVDETQPSETQQSPMSFTTTAPQTDLSATFEAHESPVPQLEDLQLFTRVLQSLTTSQNESHQPSSTTSPMNEQLPSETSTSSTAPTGTAPPTDLSISSAGDRSPSLQPEEQQESSEFRQPIFISQEEIQPPFTTALTEEQVSPTSPVDSNPLGDVSPLPEINQSFSPSPNEQSNLSGAQEIASTASQEPWTDENTQEQLSSISADEYRTRRPLGAAHDRNQFAGSPVGYDNAVGEPEQKSESSSKQSDEIDKDAHRLLSPSIDEHETNQSEKEESSFFNLTGTPLEEAKQNINSLNLEDDLPTTEEQISSSDYNQLEEDSSIGYVSSSGYYGTLNDSSHKSSQKVNKKASRQASLTDVEVDNTDPLLGEVDQSTSPKSEENDFDGNNESTLEAVMQDLRYVYRDLADDEDLVEITDEFPDNLIDRLEFGDNLIRTLFDGFLRKYLVQPAKNGLRSKTLDWTEFRDILFPIVTGHYMERHIRKLFDLFDTSQDGHLSLEEITELFELLQVTNTTDLAEYLIHEFDKNQDGKLNIDEFIEVMKKRDDINSNILPEKIEYKPWFTLHPIEEINNDVQSISLEVPAVDYASQRTSSRTETINNGIIMLARIFKRVGVDVENKLLDSKKPALSMKLTNEFIHNNIYIPKDDLHLFIDLYLNKKQNSDRLINWDEFRDVFLPFVNGGLVSKSDISRWFDILDTNHKSTITQEQILHLLRLVRIPNPENILNKMNEISGTYTNNDDSWTLEEVLFALDNIDETTIRLYTNDEPIKSFNREWFAKNIF